MQDRPRTLELLEAVQLFLETEILPGLDNEGLRFRCRVAANVLRIAGRDLALHRSELETTWRELNGLWKIPAALPADTARLDEALAVRLRALCVAIRDRAEPAGTAEVLESVLRGQLRGSNPAWLAAFAPV